MVGAASLWILTLFLLSANLLNRGEWCNVQPAGFGPAPTTKTNNTVVDALVWVKPGGESDGQCGMAGAPKAGEWFDEYAQMLVKNADSSIFKLF